MFVRVSVRSDTASTVKIAILPVYFPLQTPLDWLIQSLYSAPISITFISFTRINVTDQAAYGTLE